MHRVGCFSQVIVSSCRTMWIFWCLWILLIIQSCNGNGDTNFAIERVGSDVLNVSEGDDVTMTCSYDINYDSLNITSGAVVFTWFENVTSDEPSANQYRQLTGDKSKIIMSYALADNRDTFDIDSYGGSTRFIERTDTSSSLTIQNVQSVHDGPYFCAIYTEAISNAFALASDYVNLAVFVEPKLKVYVDDWIVENVSASITCSAQTVKPSVSSMVIKISNERVKGKQYQIEETKNEDKTFKNSFSASFPVTRSDNGKRVSCEATWNGRMEMKTFISNTETLRVVWPIDTPKDIRVKPGIESCSVRWRNDPNERWVTICHEPSPLGQQCTTLTATVSLRYKIIELDTGENYSVWMSASNELGSSGNTLKQQCIPLATRARGTATSTASSLKNDGLSLATLLCGISIGSIFQPFVN